MITMKRWHFYFALWCALLTGQLIIPLIWKAAAAQDKLPDLASGLAPDVTLAAGVGPDGKMAQIRVDDQGRVICSQP